jgi:hypothetical protein
MGVLRVPCTGWTFRVIGVLLPKVGEDVERQATAPGHDGEKTPALRQAFGSRFKQAVKRQVPASAEGDAVANVLIARSAKQLRIIRGNRAISLPEARGIVDAVSVGVRQSEVGASEIM